MSDISPDYISKEILVKAMAGLGTLVEQALLHPYETMSSSAEYDLVLMNPNNSDERIAFNHKNGIWQQAQIDSNCAGTWTTSVSTAIKQRYWLFEQQQKMIEAGWDTGIAELEDGAIEVHAFPKWTKPRSLH
jgi:tRNA U34 5-carboxymethylaminomethyl modifying enzyme MnmG/GidA